MAQLGRQIDERMTYIRERERQLMELEKAITETEKSYDIVPATLRRSSKPPASSPTPSKLRRCTCAA